VAPGICTTTATTNSAEFERPTKCLNSVGDDLNQMIYKSRFKSFPTTYDFDLNQFSSHDS